MFGMTDYMQHGESNFQQLAVRMLRAAGFTCFSVPNGTKLSRSQARIAVAEGMTAGVADLIVLLPGRAVFAEFKNPNGKGRQSPPQRAFEDTVKALGFDYFIWDGWDKVEAFIALHQKEVSDWMKTGGTD